MMNIRRSIHINVSEAYKIAALTVSLNTVNAMLLNKTNHMVKIHETVLGIADRGLHDGRCRLNGVVGDVFSILFERLQEKGFGCIATAVDSIGVRDGQTNQYDGALGQIQRGEADFVGMPVYFPLNETEEKFRYSPMLHADTMTILSQYWVNTTKHDGDIITMFANIPSGLWIGYFMSFVTFVLVSYTGSKLLGHMVGSFWMTICAFLDQDNYPLSSSKFISFMSFIVMLGMFFMMTYACNSMGTDLVSIDKPFAITTYEQIISGKITTLLCKILPEWERFSSAEEGSNEWAFFHNKIPLSLDFSTGSTAVLYEPLIHQKAVFITRPFVAVTLALMFIAMGWSADARMFAAPDPQATSYMNVFVHSARLKDTPLERYMNLMTGRLGEHGFADFVQTRSGPLIVRAAMEGVMGDAGSPSHQQFITSKIEEQSADVMAIAFSHVYKVLIMLFIGSIVGALALASEHFLELYSKKWNTQPTFLIKRK